MRYYELLTEIKRKKKKRKKKHKKKTAYGGYFYPGFAFAGDGSGGGGDGGRGESMYEGTDNSSEDKKQMSTDITSEVQKFNKWACDRLSIKNPPKIELSYDTEEAQEGHHTGRHIMGSDSVWVYAANRNLVDILRTTFHELVHVRQNELGMIDDGDSYPGSPIEAMADMLAGKYLKIYGKANRKIFQ